MIKLLCSVNSQLVCSILYLQLILGRTKMMLIIAAAPSTISFLNVFAFLPFLKRFWLSEFFSIRISFQHLFPWTKNWIKPLCHNFESYFFLFHPAQFCKRSELKRWLEHINYIYVPYACYIHCDQISRDNLFFFYGSSGLYLMWRATENREDRELGEEM